MSASSIASNDCPAIRVSTPSSVPSIPPVSTMMNSLPSISARPYLRSRVSPGKSATNASRVLVKRLNKVDLPTFGRPTSATTGIILKPQFLLQKVLMHNFNAKVITQNIKNYSAVKTANHYKSIHYIAREGARLRIFQNTKRPLSYSEAVFKPD